MPELPAAEEPLLDGPEVEVLGALVEETVALAVEQDRELRPDRRQGQDLCQDRGQDLKKPHHQDAVQCIRSIKRELFIVHGLLTVLGRISSTNHSTRIEVANLITRI